MDLGFSDIVGAVERHFGTGLTRFVLGLVTLTLCLLCVGAIYNEIKPILGAFAPGFIDGSVKDAAVKGLLLGLAFSGTLSVMYRQAMIRDRREALAKYHDALSELERIRALKSEIRAFLDNLLLTIDKSELLLDTLARALETGAINGDDREALKALLTEANAISNEFGEAISSTIALDLVQKVESITSQDTANPIGSG